MQPLLQRDASPPEAIVDPRFQLHWRRQRRRIAILLTIWAGAGLVVSILFVQFFNQFSLGGFPFGFWMAQQGSIFLFVVLIFLYAFLSDRADRKSGFDEKPGASTPPPLHH